MPLKQFMAHQGLDTVLSSVILSGIALHLDDESDLTTEEGLHRIHRHFKSMGRYGSGALLMAHYGTVSELCQSFCRFSNFNLDIQQYMALHLCLDSNRKKY